MEDIYTIPLSQLEKEFSLERIWVPEDYDTVLVRTPEVSRPGLALAGFYGIFERDRIQIIGNAEHKYLVELAPDEREKALVTFIKALPVAVLFTTGNEVFPELIKQAQISGVPILRTQEHTSPIMAALIASLNQHLAPRITRHGVLVEVYGEGILLLGDSGVGKSETAIELVKRGHRLIADDAVEIKRVSAKTLVGSAPEIIRHYVELRGIGIVDIRRLFGMGAVKETEAIDLV
ncbi:MAG: HPr(Ser) kinase/phosphatase, partial [Clostridia bacterium]|nr:HPr(Ser) kinase/phosphatase [Clostridia bacterium]